MVVFVVDHVLIMFKEDYFHARSINDQISSYDIIIMVVCSSPRHNLKKCDFGTFFKTVGLKFIAAGVNSKYYQREGIVKSC